MSGKQSWADSSLIDLFGRSGSATSTIPVSRGTVPGDKMRINYHDRYFRSIGNVGGGDVDADTLFHYRQQDDVVWATYRGGGVTFGTLTALVLPDGRLDMRYQQVSKDGMIKTGRCLSTPEMLPDGRLRLHESWSWTEGGEGAGESRIEEIPGSNETRPPS